MTKTDLWKKAKNPFSLAFMNYVVTSFNEYLSIGSIRDEVEVLGKEWKKDKENNYRYSLFFTPYDRHSNGGPHKDMKDVLQVCPSFLPEFRQLSDDTSIQRMANICELFCNSAPFIFDYYIQEFRSSYSELYKLMEMDSPTPPVSVRLIRYTGDGMAGTNFHVDKTALSCILYDSTWKTGSKLIMETSFGYQTAPLDSETGVVFTSAALKESGATMLPPIPHAVSPIPKGYERVSVVLFWMLPGVDMSNYNTKITPKSPLPNSRLY